MLALLFALALPLSPPPVTAQAVVQGSALPAERQLPYRRAQVWRATLRLLRVDRGWVIDDQDEGAGYILFHAPGEKGRSLRGSVELIARDARPRRPGIRVRAKVHNASAHAAFTLLEALQRKVRQDFGPPPAPGQDPGEAEPNPPKEAPKDKGGAGGPSNGT